MAIDVQNFLTAQRLAHPELAADLDKIENLYSKKLWHQLTVFLVEFVKRPEFQTGEWLVGLYNCFLVDFEAKLNQLSLVEIVFSVIRQLPSHDARISFLEGILKKVSANKAATVACNMAIADFKLQLGDLEGCKALLEEAQQVLDANDDIGLAIHAMYYRLSAQYQKVKASFGDFYREALRYLGCIDEGTLSIQEQQDYAFDLGLAAILSPDLYNFGELIAHPVLNSLKGTGREWMVKLLFAFNRGDIGEFEALQSYWQSQALLVEHVVSIRKKMCLMCLMEIVFARPSDSRTIPFDVIATQTRLPVDDVEYLVMRALSLKLIRGTIDEVTKTVRVTWVQPRVLDRQQVEGMAVRLAQWCANVENTIATASVGDADLTFREE
eukprot:comp19344_c0_seq1/m.22270 comp19344_c0_seq1/g.22270  ORF comp19344_c0_seq1/g.22270 comp19344_c0_seq1/m.22270 type:complete len:382 (-) comp19344_c0_seq1:94-1239(-)